MSSLADNQRRHLAAFPDNVKAAGQTLTNLTLKLFNELVVRLPPTPSKFHYVFNLRDLSRIYEGLLLSTPDKINTPVRTRARPADRRCTRRAYDDGDRRCA